MKRSFSLSSPLGLLLLVFLQAIFVAWYVGSERTVYFWDHAMYFDMARSFFRPQEGVLASDLFLNALGQDYNLIFALPSYLFFLLFGLSRLVFILANFVCFFLPFEAVSALFLRRLFGWSFYKAALFSLIGCSLIPPLWYPLLEGYPDIGAAACVVFCLSLLVGEKRRWIEALELGASCSLAILLRRHFAYPILAVLLAGGFFDLLRLVREKSSAAFLKSAAFWIGTGTFFLGSAFFIAPIFMLNAFTVNYTALYASYKNPIFDFLFFVLGHFGAFLLLLSLFGIWLSRKLKGVELLSLATFLWLGLWVLGPAEAGHHYLIHLLPVFCLVGMGSLFEALRPLKYGLVLRRVGCVLLAFNALWALVFAPVGEKPDYHGGWAFFSAQRPPVVRQDLDELKSLGQALAGLMQKDDVFMCLGSSSVFNQDLFLRVLALELDRKDLLSKAVMTSEIDVKQLTPLNSFAEASLYIRPEPMQFHLAPEGQKVVASTAAPFRNDLFLDDPAFFSPVSRAFQLEEGVRVRIWRRKPWTPGALYKTIGSMKEVSPSDQAWILLTPFLPSLSAEEPDGTLFRMMMGQEPVSLFYDEALSSGQAYSFATKAEIASSCYQTGAVLSLQDASGKVIWKRPLSASFVSGNYETGFDVPPNGGPFFLFLQLEGHNFGRSACEISFHQLRVF